MFQSRIWWEDQIVGSIQKGDVFGEMGVLRLLIGLLQRSPLKIQYFTDPRYKFYHDGETRTSCIHRLLQWAIRKSCERLRQLDGRLDTFSTRWQWEVSMTTMTRETCMVPSNDCHFSMPLEGNQCLSALIDWKNTAWRGHHSAKLYQMVYLILEGTVKVSPRHQHKQ